MIKPKTILILPTGKVLTFAVPSLATVYQQAYGGTIISSKPVKYKIEACQMRQILVQSLHQIEKDIK